MILAAGRRGNKSFRCLRSLCGDLADIPCSCKAPGGWRSPGRFAYFRNHLARVASWSAAALRRFSQSHIKLCLRWLKLPAFERVREIRQIRAIRVWFWIAPKNLKKDIALEGRFVKFHVRFQTEGGEI